MRLVNMCWIGDGFGGGVWDGVGCGLGDGLISIIMNVLHDVKANVFAFSYISEEILALLSSAFTP